MARKVRSDLGKRRIPGADEERRLYGIALTVLKGFTWEQLGEALGSYPNYLWQISAWSKTRTGKPRPGPERMHRLANLLAEHSEVLFDYSVRVRAAANAVEEIGKLGGNKTKKKIKPRKLVHVHAWLKEKEVVPIKDDLPIIPSPSEPTI